MDLVVLESETDWNDAEKCPLIYFMVIVTAYFDQMIN
jgi:hypothetical protein